MLPALGPLVASLLGPEAAAAIASTLGMAGTGSAGAAGTAASAAATRATVSSGVANAAAQFNGVSASQFIQASIGTAAGAGIGGGPGSPGAFHQSMIQAIGGLEQFYDTLQLADSALTKLSSGGVDMLRRPTSTMLGTFELQMQEAISGKGLPTASVQRGLDSAWKMSGMGFAEQIPILGILPSAFKDLLDSIIGMPNAIEQWGEALLKNRFELARWNGSIAGTKVEAERREILRDIASGQATSGTTAELNAAMQDLKDTMRPLNDTMINGFNLVTTSLVRGFTMVAKHIDTVGRTMVEVIKAMPGVGIFADQIERAIEKASEKDSRGGIAFVEFMSRMVDDKSKNPPPPKSPSP